MINNQQAENHHHNPLGGGNKLRNSSIELFRILATFLVLIVHLNGWMAGGLVEWNDPDIPMIHKVCQLIIQSLSVVCVNCFLVISGWYGIKLKFVSVWKMWVMLFSIYVPFYFASYFFGSTQFSILGLATKILAFPCESYFVQNYLMLMFISPILNTFIETKKEKLTVFAFCLFSIEVIMESVFQNKCLYIENGYSLFHFVTMYMLARTASMHKERILKVKKLWWIMGYFACAALVCLLHFSPYKHTWAYSNPIIIAESFMLFFPFLYRTFHNRYINWVAGSTLAIYIIQVTSPVSGLLFKYDQFAVANLPYTTYLPLLFGFCILFFAVCLIYNEASHRVLNPILNPIKNYLESKISNFIS